MRRLTLALVALLTATLTCTTASAQRDDAASKKLGIELGMQCYTYRQVTTFEALERCQKFGIKYAEIYPGQKMKPGSDTKIGTNLTDDEMAELLAKAKSCGVTIHSFGVSGMPDKAEADARKHFEWAKKMGLKVLVTETTPNEMLDKLSQEAGIKIALHNHPRSWPADKVLEATKNLSKNCGACADTGHWLRAGKNPIENLKLLEGRVIGSHFKDLDDKKSDVVFGMGIADVKGMLQELKRQGFKGVLNIEYEHGNLEHLDQTIPLCVAAFDKLCAEASQ